MEVSIPCTIMRGGTSKGLFFLESDLPASPLLRQLYIAKAFGSPDPFGRQVNGLGGATSTTSKVAIIGKREGEKNAVNYTFGQVDIGSLLIDMRGNCGNISVAVGPFALDAGLVDEVEEPYTKINIYNTNTKKYIVAHVPTRDGKCVYEGDFVISGVPSPGSRIRMDFTEPGGAVTGKLLPTGNVRDILSTRTGRTFEVSIVDAANPFVYVRAADVGVTGQELPADMDGNRQRLETLLEIRAAAAVLLGLATDEEDAYRNSPAVPKISIVAPPATYRSLSGQVIHEAEFDISARMLSMGKLHPSYAVTGGICLAVAAKIEGTIVHETVRMRDPGEEKPLRIGQCSGITEVGAKVIREHGGWHAVYGTTYSTARRLMRGQTYILLESEPAFGCRIM